MWEAEQHRQEVIFVWLIPSHVTPELIPKNATGM